MKRKTPSTPKQPQTYVKHVSAESWREGFEQLVRHTTSWSLADEVSDQDPVPPYPDEELEAILSQRDHRSALAAWLDEVKTLARTALPKSGGPSELVDLARHTLQAGRERGSAEYVAAELAISIHYLMQSLSGSDTEPQTSAYLAAVVEGKAQALRLLTQVNPFDSKTPKRTPVAAADDAANRYLADAHPRSPRDPDHITIMAEMLALVSKGMKPASAARLVAQKWHGRSAKAIAKRYTRAFPTRNKNET